MASKDSTQNTPGYNHKILATNYDARQRSDTNWHTQFL